MKFIAIFLSLIIGMSLNAQYADRDLLLSSYDLNNSSVTIKAYVYAGPNPVTGGNKKIDIWNNVKLTIHNNTNHELWINFNTVVDFIDGSSKSKNLSFDKGLYLAPNGDWPIPESGLLPGFGRGHLSTTLEYSLNCTVSSEKEAREKKIVRNVKIDNVKIHDQTLEKESISKAAEEKRIQEQKEGDKKILTAQKEMDAKKESATTSSTTSSSATNNTESALQQQAAKTQSDDQYQRYLEQRDASQKAHFENVQKQVNERQEMLNTYNNLYNQQQQNIQNLQNSLQNMADHFIQQASEKRRAREAYEEEMERKREEARFRQEEKELKMEIRLENRKSLLSQFPDQKMPLSQESIGTEVLYFFAYYYDQSKIQLDYCPISVTPVFPIYKYGDGTWIYKNELIEKLALVNEGKTVSLVGYFLSAEKAATIRNYFSADAKKYEMDVYKLREFTQTKPSDKSSQIDFWGNTIKKN